MKNLFRRLGGFLLARLLRWRSRPYPGSAGPILVVAPHADDETLGCGGLLATCSDARAAPRVVFVSNSAGSPEEPASPGQAAQRRAEALAALALLGVPPAQVHFLDAQDGRLDRLPPAEAARVQADFVALLRQIQPAEVFMPYLGGGSSEHDGAAQLTRAAVAAAGVATRIWEYPVWAWWDPRRLVRQLKRPQENFRLELGAQRARKRRALACHVSQCATHPPRLEPALPPVLAALCTGPVEFFFLRQP